MGIIYTEILTNYALSILRNCRDSINTYRGTHPLWKDYFDQFLQALYGCMHSLETADTGLENLLEMNRKAFLPYSGPEGFGTLVERLLLSDYLDGNGLPRHLFRGTYYWKRNLAREEYLKDVDQYLNFCEGMIDRRGKRMVALLKEKW